MSEYTTIRDGRAVMWKKIRITALLGILVFVSGQTISQQLWANSWVRPLNVVIYPLAGDNSIITSRYIDRLRGDDFADIERFMRHEARRYGVHGDVLNLSLAPQLRSAPPPVPDQAGMVQSIAFSLYFRFWALVHDRSHAPGDIRLFVVFHDPDRSQDLPRSIALRKGILGLVHVFADASMQPTNNFVIGHEMLHTLGATDKYDLGTNLPQYPQGYARPFQRNPDQQVKAEIMGGRIPVDRWTAVMPGSLDDAVIGAYTALEIHWF